MKSKMHGIIAGALLLAAAASPFAANAADSASTDRQFAWFMRNLETTDGSYPPAPAFSTPASRESAPRLPAQPVQMESYLLR